MVLSSTIMPTLQPIILIIWLVFPSPASRNCPDTLQKSLGLLPSHHTACWGNAREVKVPPENKGQSSSPEKQVLQKHQQPPKEGFAHFFTSTRWSTAKSQNNATVSGLTSNSEPRGLNHTIMHLLWPTFPLRVGHHTTPENTTIHLRHSFPQRETSFPFLSSPSFLKCLYSSIHPS